MIANRILLSYLSLPSSITTSLSPPHPQLSVLHSHPCPGEAADGLCTASKHKHQEDEAGVDHIAHSLVPRLAVTLQRAKRPPTNLCPKNSVLSDLLPFHKVTKTQNHYVGYVTRRNTHHQNVFTVESMSTHDHEHSTLVDYPS